MGVSLHTSIHHNSVAAEYTVTSFVTTHMFIHNATVQIVVWKRNGADIVCVELSFIGCYG